MHVHHLKCQILFWVRSKWSLLQFSPFLTSFTSQGHNNSRYWSISPQTNFSSEYHKMYIFWLQKSLLDCVFDVGQIVQTFLKIAGFWPIFGLFLTICYYYGSKIGLSINFWPSIKYKKFFSFWKTKISNFLQIFVVGLVFLKKTDINTVYTVKSYVRDHKIKNFACENA